MADPSKAASSASPQTKLAAVIKTARDAMRKDAGRYVGRAVVAALQSAGHEPVAPVHHDRSAILPGIEVRTVTCWWATRAGPPRGPARTASMNLRSTGEVLSGSCL